MYNFMAERVVQALCWTLIHSLWQAFILAITAAVFVQAARKAKPQTRYNILLLLFSIQILLSAATFCVLSTTQHSAVTGYTGSFQGHFAEQIVPAAAVARATAGPFSGFGAFLSGHALLIVDCWLLIMVLLSGKMLIGVLYVRKIRGTDVIPVNAYWDQYIANMAKSAKIKTAVRMVQSGLIRVPMVTGFLKPIIMLPIGLLSDYNLSQAQIEAILYHELAHIRRHDYIINLLQNVLEIVFFFNPFVWWMSALLRDEREFCCDAEVVPKFSDKRTMVEALVSFQASMGRTPRFGMAFGGNSNFKLLQRAKQIFNGSHDGVSSAAKIVLTTCLIIFLFGSIAIYGKGQGQPLQTRNTIHHLKDLNMPSQADTTKKDEESKMKAAAEIKLKEAKAREQEATVRLQEARKRLQLDSATAEEKKIRKEVVEEMEEELREAIEDTKGLEAEIRGDMVMINILDDLMKDKIISSRNSASFKLGKEAFVVNGKVQSPEIHMSYFKKYGADNQTTYYNWKN
jgi:beta-lactamase regulating signal transducer with metallopeptidase domain